MEDDIYRKLHLISALDIFGVRGKVRTDEADCRVKQTQPNGNSAFVTL